MIGQYASFERVDETTVDVDGSAGSAGRVQASSGVPVVASSSVVGRLHRGSFVLKEWSNRVKGAYGIAGATTRAPPLTRLDHLR
jgi:hypothetical protein